MAASWVELVPTAVSNSVTNGSDSLGPLAGRSSHSLTAVGEVLYLFGGEHVPRVPIGSAMYKLELKERQWKPVEASGSIPSPRVAHAAAALGHVIYVFGGRSGVDMGEGALDDFFSFDTASGTWAPLPRGPPPRSYHALAANEVTRKLYAFGGCGAGSAGRLNDLWEFDTAHGTWAPLPSCPEIKGRGGAGLAVDAAAGHLYVVGGFAGHELGDVHRFDLAANTWEEVRTPKSALRPRSMYGGAHVIGRHLLVTCGEVDPSEKGHEGAGQYANDTCALDLDDVEAGWQVLSAEGAVPAPRGWHAAARLSSSMYVHGGISETGDRLCSLLQLDLSFAA